MPAEPPIEKLLEAYRQKRRAAAGEPLAPHPATRQLLQGEVARTYGTFQPGPAPERVSWLAAFWPRLALGGSAFALVAFVLFQVQTGQPPRRSETASDTPAAGARGLARNPAPGEKQDFLGDTPAPAPAKTQPMPAPVVSDPAVLLRAEALAGTLELGAFRDAALKNQEKDAKSEAEPAARKLALTKSLAPAGPAPVATSTPLSATAAPPAAPTRMSREIQPPRQAGAAPAPGITSVGQDARVAALASDAARAGTKATADFYFTTAGVEAAQAYRYVNPRPDLRQNFNSPAPPEVLVNFQVAVSGDRVRFTDADGSTYEGRLLPADGESANRAVAKAAGLAKAKVSKPFAAAPGAKEELEKKAADAPAVEAAKIDTDKRNFSDELARGADRGNLGFVVSGTNRRLNQQVEFRGQFQPVQAEDPGLPQLRADAELPGENQTAKGSRWLFETKQPQALPSASTDRRKQSLADNGATAAAQQSFPLPAAPKPAATASQLSAASPAPIATPTPQPSAPRPPGLAIRGWAVIGGSNQFEIRAVPTPRP